MQSYMPVVKPVFLPFGRIVGVMFLQGCRKSSIQRDQRLPGTDETGNFQDKYEGGERRKELSMLVYRGFFGIDGLPGRPSDLPEKAACIQFQIVNASMTMFTRHSRASGNPCAYSGIWIPAFAGMADRAATMFRLRVR